MSIFDKLATKVTQEQAVNNFTPRELPRAGVALLRLRSYLELGVKAPKDPTHKPQRSVRLTFELHHPDHMISGTKEDGTTYAFPDTLNVYVNIAGPTSKFGKLFAKMNYLGTAVHMSQLVGMPFLGSIHHNEWQGKTYVNLNNDANEWTIGAPIHTDVMTNATTNIPVPELDGQKQVFLYDHPELDEADIREMWDAIYIDGVKQDGSSKNWIQEAIKESLTWDTSKTKQAVEGATDIVLPGDGVEPSKETNDTLAALGLS